MQLERINVIGIIEDIEEDNIYYGFSQESKEK